MVLELPKLLGIDIHSINKKNDKKLAYTLIYSFKFIELKVFNTYFKINLANNFIQQFKFFSRASILFDKKFNSSFHFYIH